MIEVLVISIVLSTAQIKYTVVDRFILREDIVDDSLKSVQAHRFALYDRNTGFIHFVNSEMSSRRVVRISDYNPGGWTFEGKTQREISREQTIYQERDALLIRYETTTVGPLGFTSSQLNSIYCDIPELTAYDISDLDNKFFTNYNPQYTPFEFEFLRYLIYDSLSTQILHVTIDKAEFDSAIIDSLLQVPIEG